MELLLLKESPMSLKESTSVDYNHTTEEIRFESIITLFYYKRIEFVDPDLLETLLGIRKNY